MKKFLITLAQEQTEIRESPPFPPLSPVQTLQTKVMKSTRTQNLIATLCCLLSGLASAAARYGVKMSPEVPMKHQERAWSSPIWYNP